MSNPCTLQGTNLKSREWSDPMKIPQKKEVSLRWGCASPTCNGMLLLTPAWCHIVPLSWSCGAGGLGAGGGEEDGEMSIPGVLALSLIPSAAKSLNADGLSTHSCRRRRDAWCRMLLCKLNSGQWSQKGTFEVDSATCTQTTELIGIGNGSSSNCHGKSWKKLHPSPPRFSSLKCVASKMLPSCPQ